MSRFLTLAAWLAAISMVSVSTADETSTDTTDYTCDPNFDYAIPKPPGSCPTEKIQDGVCDNPNHGGDDDSCLEQDCIDCNKFCTQFNTDCFGCLNAKGCYYCPGDATCQNSNLYQSTVEILSCTAPEDFWLGGTDNPDELCIPSDALTQDPVSLTNNWVYKMINVDQVWPEYTGEGISIRINDLGVDPNNDDFEGRFDEANSCANFGPAENPDGSLDSHGTRVAGIIAANANNNFCAAGIAYDSTFTSCNVIGLSYQDFNEKIESIDISQNSIQVETCGVSSGVSTPTPTPTLQGGLQGCPFSAERNEFFDPCNPEICDFANQDTAGLSSVCEDAIFAHCRDNYRDDVSACLDFMEILLRGNECDYDILPQSAIDAIAEGATQGREGKGIIYVFASGNGFYYGEDANFSRWPNSRYTITVGAVGKDGLHTDYSTPGAALTVTAPAGDRDDAAHIVTTGLGNTCRDSGFGTSFSSPVVSGVIALMLEARPELTWRDVQGILAETSTVPTDPKDNTKATNAAGVTHSNWYGFGLIDAKKAVDSALTWTLVTPEYQAIGESAEENQPIPNDGTEYVSELTMSSDYSGFTTEATVVMINLQHYQRGDLELTLVSPSGTESILHPGRRPEDNQPKGDQRWKLMTLRNWGEDPSGTWQLKFKDLETGNTPTDGLNELRQWKIVVYGRTEDGLPPVLSSPSPTVVPDPSDRTPVATATPTISAPTTLSPTSSPTTIRFKRPTTIIKNKVHPGAPPVVARGNTRAALPAYSPGTRSPPVPYKPPERNPLDQLLLAPRDVSPTKAPKKAKGKGGGNKVGKSTKTATQNDDRIADLILPFVRFGEADEMQYDSNVSFRLLQNISLVLEGVDEDIPETSWSSLQYVLDVHTMTAVDEALPELHIVAEVHLTSATLHNTVRNREMRNLQPTNGPFVTIVYDAMIRFNDLTWTGEMLGIDLVGLPFSDSTNREAFVKKLQNRLDKDRHPWLENLVGVSPNKEGVVVETPIVFASANISETTSEVESDVIYSTPNDMPKNNTETIAKVEEKKVNPSSAQTNSENSNQTAPVFEVDIIDPKDNILTILIWWIGTGILCLTLMLIFRRQRLHKRLQEEDGLSRKI